MSKPINLSEWKRLEHYKAFLQMDNPHFSICTQIDINSLLKSGEKVFPKMLHSVHQAAEPIKEFRTRISGSDVLLFETLDISFNILAEDRLFSNCRLSVPDNYKDFEKMIDLVVKEKSRKGVIDIDPNQDEGLLLTSFIPWMSFTGLSEPTFGKFDSIPRVTWGKYNSDGLLPVSVQVNHALMDGVHVAEFFEILRREIESD